MKRLLLVLVVLALPVVACFDWTNSQTGPTNIPSPTPAPTPVATPTPVASACNPVARVVVNAPSQISIGVPVVIDATPKDAQGSNRPPACDQEAGIFWKQSGPCAVSSQIVFNPQLVGGPISGICLLTATVGGVESSVATVLVG